MKLIILFLFLFSQSLVYGAGSSSPIDANQEYLKAENLIKSEKYENAIKALNNLFNAFIAFSYFSDLIKYLAFEYS